MRWVVTGAAGFIGSHLSEALVQRGDEVVGVDCFTDYYDPGEKEENARDLDVLRIDLADDSLDLDGVDGVFHLAGQPGVRSFGDAFPLYLRRNVLAAQRVFQSAAEAGVRVVFASSSSVYGEAERYPTPEDTHPQPISPYGITKLACEQLAHAYAVSFGLEAVALRYFTVYGPRQRPDLAIHKFCRAIASGKPIPMLGDGSTQRDYTDASDIIRGIRSALDWTEAAGPGFEVVNLGGARPTSLIDLVRHLERLLSRPAVLDWQEPQPGDVPVTYADVRHAGKLLGYEPRVPLEEGLARFVQWFMSGEWS